VGELDFTKEKLSFKERRDEGKSGKGDEGTFFGNKDAQMITFLKIWDKLQIISFFGRRRRRRKIGISL